MRGVIILLFLSMMLQANEFFEKISPIDNTIKTRMIKGNSYRSGCPVGLNDLRYVEVSHYDFEGKCQIGELIVHRSIAQETVDIFRDLFRMGYPIRQMKLVSNYHGNDFASIEADNTSAFNCRFIGGTNKWSNHAYGKAIDINPLENPYVNTNGKTVHKRSVYYLKRVRQSDASTDLAMLLPHDEATQAFKKRGWIWGGDWYSIKDYQHFEKR